MLKWTIMMSIGVSLSSSLSQVRNIFPKSSLLLMALILRMAGMCFKGDELVIIKLVDIVEKVGLKSPD